MRRKMLCWGKSNNLWKRRTAIICQLLTPNTVLWTIDKKLDALAARLNVTFGGDIE